MYKSAFHRLLAVLLVAFFSFPAIAQHTKDVSANKKIDEAINQHYLMMELDKAESLLSGVVEACGLKCKGATKAKAWMYVGIVRGSGRNDQAGAKEAFEKAKAFDPNVKLDDGLATPETKQTFASVAGGGAGATQETPPADDGSSAMAAKLSGQETIPGDMICTPENREIQTRMPIPVSCSSALEPEEVLLRFKEPGATRWKQLTMDKVGNEFRATIPCDLTSSTGEVQWYVGAKDSVGEYIDQYGSKDEPALFVLSESAAGPAPAFPGGQPVTRCGGGGGGGAADEASSDCPPDFPGCESDSSQQCGPLDWGAACDHSGQCGCGLICEGGACDNAPSCSTDEECDVGSCIDGYCSVPAGAEPDASFKRHWLSFDVGVDLSSIGGNNLCILERESNYGSFCYDQAGARAFPVGVNVNTGLALAQIRIKAGYDFAFANHFMVGARAGVAFLNTDPAFIPVHAEGRFTYVITKLSEAGFRPSLFVNGGLGEVDAHLDFTAPSGAPLDIYKRAGPAFVGGGLGLGYAFSPNAVLELEIAAGLGLGTGLANLSIQPSLGFSYGL